MNKSETKGDTPGKKIDARIKELTDWRGPLLARVREIIRQADPNVVEEWKWNIPVWSHNGIICTGETYKNHVKLTFAKGASLSDPSGIFTSSLEGRVRRAVDYYENDKVKVAPLQALVKEAVKLNTSKAR